MKPFHELHGLTIGESTKEAFKGLEQIKKLHQELSFLKIWKRSLKTHGTKVFRKQGMNGLNGMVAMASASKEYFKELKALKDAEAKVFARVLRMETERQTPKEADEEGND